MTWSREMISDHKTVAKLLNAIKDDVFDFIKDSPKISEFDIQEFVKNKFKKYNLKTDKWRPIISFRQNTSLVHYYATRDNSKRLQPNSLILVDLWARINKKGSPFADITWMGYYGDKVPKNIEKVFNIVVEARNKTIDFIKKELKKKIIPIGKEIDSVARNYVTNRGFGDFFDHGTGHPLGFISDHGHGVNLNPKGSGRLSKIVGYTIEPGIYLKNNFGVRSEIDFYIDSNYKLRITTPIQSKIIIIRPSKVKG